MTFDKKELLHESFDSAYIEEMLNIYSSVFANFFETNFVALNSYFFKNPITKYE